MKFTNLSLNEITGILFLPAASGKDRKTLCVSQESNGKRMGLCILFKTPTPWKQPTVCTACSRLLYFKINYCKCSRNMKEIGKTSYKAKQVHIILVLECQNNGNFIVNSWKLTQKKHHQHLIWRFPALKADTQVCVVKKKKAEKITRGYKKHQHFLTIVLYV